MEEKKPPTPPEIIALRCFTKRLWLSLTGGEQGCPRKSFFLRMVPAAFLLAVISQYLAPCILVLPHWWMRHYGDSFIELDFLCALLGLLALGLGGGATSIFSNTILNLGFLPRLFAPLPAPEDTAAIDALNFNLYRLGGHIGTPLALLLAAIIFGLGWRRLRDAGRSPLWLLLVLWPLLPWLLLHVLLPGAALPDFPGAFVLNWLIGNIGALWLLYLYCQPSRPRPQPEPLPEKHAEEAPRPATVPASPAEDEAHLSPAPEPLDFRLPHKGRILCLIFILLQAGLLLTGVGSGSLTGMLFFLPFLGLLPALLLLLVTKQESRLDAGLRALALTALYGIFIPCHFLFREWAASDPQGAVSIFFTSPIAHALWLMLALPYLIRCCKP